MLNMQSIVLKKLKQEFQVHRPEAIGFKGSNIEPLCAIYSTQGLTKIKTQYDTNYLRSYSMMSILEILRTNYLPVSEEWQQSFKNFNCVDDLD
jgi:molybdopterin-guanine dinucleotide biosynthesis protein A